MNNPDEQFKIAFEQLEQTIDITVLQQLVEDGATAILLGHNELGTYNLAMFVKDIINIKDKETLNTAVDIVRLCIVADADVNQQKAYAGNGGMIAIEWLCLYLAQGLSELNIHQFNCCYSLFPLFAKRLEGEKTPFNMFIAHLQPSPEVADKQEHVLQQMIQLGWNHFGKDTSWFNKLAHMDVALLTRLIPAASVELEPTAIQQLLNSFTSTQQARKHFKTFFSAQPHWLLPTIMETAPETVFNLIKRNEQDILSPFLKFCKKEIMANDSLLQKAIAYRSVSDNTLQLLRQARLI